jgi:hypothetical protein
LCCARQCAGYMRDPSRSVRPTDTC